MRPRTKLDSCTPCGEQQIECHADLNAYFFDRLTRALKSRKVDAPDSTKSYLVRMLSKLGQGAAKLSRSLVELKLEAATSPPNRQISTLRELGDQALSTSGLFEANLRSRGISRRYVAEMGSGAYRTVGQLAGTSQRSTERMQAGVYWDLSLHFEDYAGVLNELCEGTSLLPGGLDLLALYERYVRTRSPEVLEQLSGLGVWLSPDPSEALH